MIKLKQFNKLSVSLFVFFSLFLFSPSLKASAYFNDSVSTDIGINLTLGNLALLPKEDETISGIDYSGNKLEKISSHTLKNSGSLAGKVAYKITVMDKNSSEPTENTEKININLTSDSKRENMAPLKTSSNRESYLFLKDTNGADFILEPDQKEELPISLSIQSDVRPEKDSDLEVTVTFLLVLANATEPSETSFYDTVSFKHDIKWLAKRNETPQPEVPTNYWPDDNDKNWKMKGEVRYNDSQFKKFMYFSEVESSGKIHNLNDNILYLELPKDKLKKDKDFTFSGLNGLQIKSEVMKNKRFIKFTFSFEKKDESTKKLLSQTDNYHMGFNYGENNSGYFGIGYDEMPVINKRLLLNTDKIISWNGEISSGYFNVASIETTFIQKKLLFSYIQENYSITSDNWVNLPLSNAAFTYKNISAEVTKNKELFDLSLQKSTKDNENPIISIATNKRINPNENKDKGELKITIEGNNGYKLIVKRDLVIAKERQTKSNLLPISDDEIKLLDEQKDSSKINGENKEEQLSSQENKNLDKDVENNPNQEVESFLEESIDEELKDKSMIEEKPPEQKEDEIGPSEIEQENKVDESAVTNEKKNQSMSDSLTNEHTIIPLQ